MMLSDIHPDLFPFTAKQAIGMLYEVDIKDEDKCNWVPDICSDSAARLGAFTNDGLKFTIKYLCERHKKMGLL